MDERFSLNSRYPVIIVGAGPVGLTAALALTYYDIPCIVLEADEGLSTETKAGTTLIRTLEIWHRFGAADAVLARALRSGEIGDIERASNRRRDSVNLNLLRDETRFPFVINIPQHHMEPALRDALARAGGPDVLYAHRLTGFTQHDDHVEVRAETPEGEKTFQASYLLACDGGRSTVRDALGVTVEGKSLPERYCLVDLKVDLDTENPRDYPYLAYFSDAEEWMILVRHPQCWRFLYPVHEGRSGFTTEELRDKAAHFIGDVSQVEVLGTNLYNIYHRVAARWREQRVLLMGDAAHLITPMWALGISTGILDANSIAWRLAWVLRGWADDTLLDGYEREQKPVAEQGSGEMAETARAYMSARSADVRAIQEYAWGNAYTRSLLGVRLDLDGSGNWSMVKPYEHPPAVMVGDRAPDGVVHTGDGRDIRLHDLFGPSFVALYFTDARRRPSIPSNDRPWLKHYVVSSWDAPHDSGFRDRALFDPGGSLARRYGCPPDTVVLVRPDDHVAAIEPMDAGRLETAYAQALLPADRMAEPA